MGDERRLVYLDPRSEEEADAMQAVILDEIRARFAIEGRHLGEHQVTELAGVIADALLDSFEVRRRPPDRPRTRWLDERGSHSATQSTVTVVELMDTFRSGLAALIPIVEQANIPWREGESYDDWDAIAGTLYEQLVVNALRHSTQVPDSVHLPRYDVVYPSYDELAHLVVRPSQDDPELGPFVGFAAEESGFHAVKFAVIDASRSRKVTRRVPFAACVITLRLPGNPPLELASVTLGD